MILFLGGMLGSGTVQAEEVFQDNFEAASPFRDSLLKRPQVSLAENIGGRESTVIKVAYVGYDRGSQRIVVRHPLAKKMESATLSFDVLFDEDFQWTLGGKLHGLGPGKPVTGGNPRRPNGWSARTMFKRDGKIATYLYDQAEDKKYGIGETTSSPVFEKGKWHRVTLAIRLNTPGQRDGFARILVDGEEVLLTEGVEFRGTGGDETLIQKLMFSTFHGGSDLKWAPVNAEGKPVTVHTYFDNFEVREGTEALP